MKSIFLFLLYMMLSMNVSGEPSSAFRYLMNEPLTLFEWGLLDLQKRTDQFEFKDLDLIDSQSYVGYDAAVNKLQIKFTLFAKSKLLQKTAAKEICKTASLKLKEKFVSTNKFIHPFLSVSQSFEHVGFRSQFRPDTFMEEIENSTEVEVMVYGSKTDSAPFKELTSCKSPLLSKELYFKDE